MDLIEGYSGIIGLSAVPMVTVAHHQSDLEAKASKAVNTNSVSLGSTATRSDSPIADTGSEPRAATPSSAARRLQSAGSPWGGLDVAVGISMAAASLGGDDYFVMIVVFVVIVVDYVVWNSSWP